VVSSGQCGVNRICALTGLSKATYYAARNPVETFQEKYEHLRQVVKEIIKANSGYGVRRIKAELLDQHQIQIGRDTLGKLLKLWGLEMKRTIKKKKPNMIQKILMLLAERTNLLIRSEITTPFEAITSDITKLKFGGGTAYWCVHKDAFGQMIYGFSLKLHMQTGLVMESLEMAEKQVKGLTQQKQLRPLLHQDRGSQYTSHRYVQQALRWTRLSYSNPGTPTHNPGQESFFGRFKDDWRDEIAEIETFEELEKFVKAKINYYNNERRHTSIGLVSPWNYTKSFLGK